MAVEDEHKPKKTLQSLITYNLKRAFNTTTISLLICYVIITLLVFNPVFSHISSRIPGTGGDSFLNLWEIWWAGYALLNLHTSLYYTYTIFWPIGANLVYQTIAPLTALISLPFQAFGLVTAYNIMLLIGILISAFGMFVLAKYITKNTYASFIAGLFYAFSASHIAQAYGHMNWIDIGFIPVLLYFLIKAIKENNIYKNALGIGISFVLITFLGGYEKAIMSIMLVVLVVVLYLLYKNTRKLILRKNFWIAAVLGIIIALILGSWGFIPIVHTLTSAKGISAAQSLNNVTYNEGWSNNLLSFFIPSYYNGIFNSKGTAKYFPSVFQSDPTEKIGYIGYIALALALYAVYIDVKAKRKRYLLWSAIALFFAWLSIGPYLQVGSAITQIPGIYAVYHAIPGINVIREPGRFFIIGTIGLDVLAAIGLTELFDKDKIKLFKSKAQNYYAITAIIAIIFIIGSSGIPYTSQSAGILSTSVGPNTFYKELGSVNGTFSVLQLPILEDYNSTQPLLPEGLANYHAALSHKPFIGGYFGRENTTQLVSVYNIPLAVQVQNYLDGVGFNYTSPVNENFTNQTLLSLYNYQTLAITLDKQEFSSTELLALEDYLGSIFGNPIYNGNSTIAFSTKSATDSAAYKSYIAYPYLPDWIPVQVPYNGSDYVMFQPVYPGPITVYAPYTNSSANSTLINSQQSISTSVSFYAIASISGSILKVALEGPTGYTLIGNFSVGKNMTEYTLNTTFVSGPSGNPLLFIPSQYDNSSTVYISGIKFSKQG